MSRTRRDTEPVDLFDDLPLQIWHVDGEGRILRLNALAQKVSGLSEAEVEGRTLLDIDLGWSDPDKHHGECLDVFSTGTPHLGAVERYTHNGENRWGRVDKVPSRNGEGERSGVLVVISDVSDHVAAQNTNTRLRQVVEATPDIVGFADPEGNALYLNQAGRRLFGKNDTDDLGRIRDYHPQWALDRVLDYGIPTAMLEGSWCGETAIIDAEGREVPVSQVLLSHPDAEGSVEFISTIVRDITSRKLEQEQEQHARRLEGVGRLAGGIAHDFNNLLTVINGYCGMMLQMMPPIDPWRSYVQDILKAGERAADLTHQLLAFSRKQILQPRLIDLNDVVLKSQALLSRLIAENFEIVTYLAGVPLSLKADPGQLEQVILHLVTNARDAMPDGGVILVETSEVALDAEVALIHPDMPPGRYVRLTVRDTGYGMDESLRRRVFEPFFTTKEVGKGTGLGLSTVYGIVAQSGGFVSVESELGLGSAFSVFLPPADDGKVVEAVERLNPLPAGTETILLVEDEEGVLEVCRQTLSMCGYTIIEARDGKEALDLIASYEGALDLVVTDVVMPHMSGRTLTGLLRKTRVDVRVLYMSGYPQRELAHLDLSDARDQFVQKPFTPTVLAVKVREVLDRAAP